MAMIRQAVLLIILLCLLTEVNAQTAKTPNFLGLNPGVTVEPFYEKGEFDINICPLVYQRPVNRLLDLRLTTVLNLGFRNDGNRISHWGGEAAMPIFFRKKETLDLPSKGFYIAPVAGFTRNAIDKHNNISLAAEPGYHLLFDNRFAMSFGLQTGVTYFNYDSGETKWRNHFGVKIIVGKWLGKG